MCACSYAVSQTPGQTLVKHATRACNMTSSAALRVDVHMPGDGTRCYFTQAPTTAAVHAVFKPACRLCRFALYPVCPMQHVMCAPYLCQRASPQAPAARVARLHYVRLGCWLPYACCNDCQYCCRWRAAGSNKASTSTSASCLENSVLPTIRLGSSST